MEPSHSATATFEEFVMDVRVELRYGSEPAKGQPEA